MRWLLLSPLLLLSCTTTVLESSAISLYGHVRDEDGRGIPGVEVRAGVHRGVSDTFGRFRLEGLPPGARTLELTRPGYESQQLDLILAGPSQYARATLWSLAGLIDQGIGLVEGDAREEAAKVAARCRAIAPQDERVLLLSEITGGQR